MCGTALLWMLCATRHLAVDRECSGADRSTLAPLSVARRHYWRAAYGYGAGVVGASLAAGPWDYYGGSACNYERTIGGYYRGVGWASYWLCGPGAYYGGSPW